MNDVTSLQEIGRSTFYESFAAVNTAEDMQQYLDEFFSIQKLTEQVNDQDSETYFAELGDEVLGYIKINFGSAQTELKGEQAMEIERIYVKKAYQGKKIGQLLFEKAVDIARQKKSNFIWLGVWEQNPGAIRFYERNGFTPFDKHLFKLGNDVQTDIMMKKKLEY